MREAHSTVARRRLVPALLAAILLPATAFGALLVAVPGADAAAGPATRVAADAPAAIPPAPAALQSTPSTTPFPPSAPADLAATSVRTNSVTLTWTASTPGCCAVAGYEITYVRAYNDIVWLVSVGDVTTATITANIAPTAQYNFRVSARDSQGRRSASSNSVTVVTPATDTGPDTTPPRAPTDLAAESVTGSSAVLTWSPSTDDVGVTGYQVYRFDGLYISTLLATVTGTSHPVSLSPGRNQFYVRARDAAGNVSIATNSLHLQGSGTPTTPPITTPPVEPASCRVSYGTQSQWTGGFVAGVTIHNTGSTPVSGWTLAFAFAGDQRIASAWNATYTQSGAAVTARGVDWNRVIPAGGSASFGLMGAWTASNASPTGFTLNDVACATG